MTDDAFETRLNDIVAGITLSMDCRLILGRDQTDEDGRFYFQIKCWRKDVITGEYGYGYGGKAYLSPNASTNELVQCAFGLFKGYWEHEAREGFTWRGRRVYGPHIDVEALWEVARRVDLRSARHVEDRSDHADGSTDV